MLVALCSLFVLSVPLVLQLNCSAPLREQKVGPQRGQENEWGHAPDGGQHEQWFPHQPHEQSVACAASGPDTRGEFQHEHAQEQLEPRHCHAQSSKRKGVDQRGNHHLEAALSKSSQVRAID